MDNSIQKLRADSEELLKLLVVNSRSIIIVTLVGAILGIAVSFMITPLYKSSMTFYPINQFSMSGVLYDNNSYMKYGSEDDVDRFLQFLNSDYITNKIIDKYDLFEHYEIDPDSPTKMSKMYKAFESNIDYTKTKFGAIVIKVYDEDPEYASGIATDVSLYLDTLMNDIKMKRAQRVLDIAEARHGFLQKQITNINDSLNTLRSEGVLDYWTQVERLTQAYGTALAENKSQAGIKKLEEELQSFGKYGGIYNYYSAAFGSQVNKTLAIENRLAEAKIDVYSKMPNFFVTNSSRTPDKKAYPVRWAIALGATVFAFVLSLVGIFAMKFLKNFSSLVKRLKEEDSAA